MYDDDDDVDYDAFDHMVLQVFEEQEDRSGMLTYPLTSQKHALDFIKLMNRKGFPYQSMCDTIGEKPETFRSWRLGNGNSEVGLIMMKRINRAVQEAMNMADAEIDDGFLEDIHSDDDTVDSSHSALADDKGADVTSPATTKTDETVSDVTSSHGASDVVVNDGHTEQPESDNKHLEDLSNKTDADSNAAAKDDINRAIDDAITDVTTDVPDGEHYFEAPCDGGKDGAVTEQVNSVTDSKLEPLQSTQTCPVMQSQSNDTNASAVDAELNVSVDVENEQESAATDSASLVDNVANSVADQTLTPESKKESDGSLDSQALADNRVDDSNVNSIAEQIAANNDVTVGKINDKEEANDSAVSDRYVEKLETAVFAEAATKDLSESESLKTDSSTTSDSDCRAAETTPNEPGQQIVSDNEPTTTEAKQTVERELEPEGPPVQKPEEPAPKVEYEASTKQLDLLSRLAMLRERASQRKTSEDIEKPPEETATSASSASVQAPAVSSQPAEKGPVVAASLPQSFPDNTSPSSSSESHHMRKTDALDSKTDSNKTELVPVESNNGSSAVATEQQPSENNSKKPTVDSCISTPDVTPPPSSSSLSSPSSEPVHKSQLSSKKSAQSTAVVETEQQNQQLAADKSRDGTASKAGGDAVVSREKVVDTPIKPPPEPRNNAAAGKMTLQAAIAKPEEQQSVVTNNSRSTADVSKSDNGGSIDAQTTTKATTTTTATATNQVAALSKEPKAATAAVGSTKQTSDVTQTNSIPSAKAAQTTEKQSKHEDDRKELTPSTVTNQQKEVTAKTSKIDDKQTASSKADDKQIDKCQTISPQQSNNVPCTKGAQTTENQPKHQGDHKELPPTSTSTVNSQQKEAAARTNKTDDMPTTSSKTDDKQTEKCQPPPSVLKQPAVTTTSSSSQQRRPLRSDVIINKKSYDGSVSDSYDSDLDAAAGNDKTYSLVDRVRKLKANVVESPGYLYVFTDQTTGEAHGGSGGGEVSDGRRFKVGVTRYPDKRYQQALSFNPSLCSLIIAKVSRRVEALRLARSKLGQFKVEGTADWFACDEETIAEAIENIVNETKA